MRKKQKTILVDEALWRRVKARAKAEGRLLNHWILSLLQEAVKK